MSDLDEFDLAKDSPNKWNVSQVNTQLASTQLPVYGTPGV